MTPDPLVVGGAVIAFDSVREFAKHIAGKLGDDVGDFVRAYSTYRLKNITAKMQRASEMLEASGDEPSPIPPRALIRWLDYASVEDDESLSERWAAILANAAIATDEEDAPPIYSAILSELTPFAAQVLDMLRDTAPLDSDRFDPARDPTRAPSMTLDHLGVDLYPEDRNGFTMDGEPHRTHRQRLDAAVDVLVRQGLATRSQRMGYEPRGMFAKSRSFLSNIPESVPDLKVEAVEIRITELGRRFLRACTPPTPKVSSPQQTNE